MATAHFVSRANKDIYENGKIVKYKSKKGKNKGSMLEKLDRTIPENKKDKILIHKGEGYYHWTFKGGNRNISKERPRPSQLTRSEYLSTLYDIQDELGELRANVNDANDLSSTVDDIKSRLEELRDEQEEKKSNMPDGLQEGPTGELLQERYDALDNAISELDGVDCDDYEEPDEDEIRTEAIEELQLDEDDEEALQDKEKEINEAIERIKEEKLSEWLDEKCDEISNVSFY